MELEAVTQKPVAGWHVPELAKGVFASRHALRLKLRGVPPSFII